MTSERVILPEQKVWDYAHGLAYKLAREQLSGIADIEQQCLKSGARYLSSEKAIIINYLDQAYRISYPGGEMTLMTDEADVPLRDKILILHYFTWAKGTPPTNKMITYKELPDGINYFPVFAKRAISPIVTSFGSQPQKLLEAARTLGGIKSKTAEWAVTIHAFSRVPLTFVLWPGDDEFAPEGSLLFDGNIGDYLANDDIHALSENLAWRLVRLLKAGGDSPGKN